MKFVSILRDRKYLTIFLVSAFAMALAYPYLQVALNGGFYNYFFWFEVLLSESFINAVFYVAFSALFGVVVSLSIYNWENRTCNLKRGLGSGGFASILGIFTSQCSACLSLASLFLPTVAVGALTAYNKVFNAISVAMLIISIYLMGGFKNE